MKILESCDKWITIECEPTYVEIRLRTASGGVVECTIALPWTYYKILKTTSYADSRAFVRCYRIGARSHAVENRKSEIYQIPLPHMLHGGFMCGVSNVLSYTNNVDANVAASGWMNQWDSINRYFHSRLACHDFLIAHGLEKNEFLAKRGIRTLAAPYEFWEQTYDLESICTDPLPWGNHFLCNLEDFYTGLYF